MRRAPRTALALAACALAGSLAGFAGCTRAAQNATTPVVYHVEPPADSIGCPDGRCAEQVEITYLGVSGFLLRAGTSVLLTGPSFTNPPVEDVLPLRSAPRVRPDTHLIERVLPRAANEAAAMLVGHGHYDHLLDAPYVLARRARRAVVYGGPTVRHTLMGDSTQRQEGGARLVAIPAESLGTWDRPGAWYRVPGSRFRVMALRSGHAPTLPTGGGVYADGRLDRDLDALPERAYEWKLGEPYAFLIDVLPGAGAADTAPVMRLYFQDAPAAPPLGFPPVATLAGRGVDVALLCVATATHVPATPDSLLRVLRPRFAVAGHWESFFRPQTLPIYPNPVSDLDAFYRALARELPLASTWQLPLPRRTVRVCACGR